MTKTNLSENTIIYLIAAVQFISILEFMIVMPLGPDFADALGIHPSKLGLIGGSYMAAAAVSGVVCSFFIDRFDRRLALGTAMLLLVLATASAGLATNIETLLMARVAAGIFGGPAMSLALAIIADTIPPERRGKAMGMVMGSFALASVAGIPAGLELAHLGGWRLPFFAIAGLGLVVAGIAIFKLPPLRSHLLVKQNHLETGSMLGLLARPAVRLSYLMTFLLMTGMFMIIPNVSAYVQNNMHFPRHSIGTLYLVGGVCSFFVMRFVGRLTDIFGPVLIATIGTFAFSAVLYCWFILDAPTMLVIPLFAAMMAFSSFRNIPYQALTSQVPRVFERARFMSVQSSVQHSSTACGAFFSSLVLSEGPDGALEGMHLVAWISIAMGMTMPLMMFLVSRMVRGQAKQDASDVLVLDQ